MELWKRYSIAHSLWFVVPSRMLGHKEGEFLGTLRVQVVGIVEVIGGELGGGTEIQVGCLGMALEELLDTGVRVGQLVGILVLTVGGAERRGEEDEPDVVGLAEAGDALEMGDAVGGSREVSIGIVCGSFFAIVPVRGAMGQSVLQPLSVGAPMHVGRLPELFELFAIGGEGGDFPVVDAQMGMDVAVHVEAVAVGQIPFFSVFQFFIEREVGDGQHHHAQIRHGVMM